MLWALEKNKEGKITLSSIKSCYIATEIYGIGATIDI